MDGLINRARTFLELESSGTVIPKREVLEQANTIIEQGEADLIFLVRELLRDPYWPLHAAHVLHYDVKWLPQYVRAKN
ncbi:MAG: hypothetical protein H0V70_24015 [Ktedonobacteraceae bacterium]|nr:hypothetical protein [Ktedonobacteraceae bacterium]